MGKSRLAHEFARSVSGRALVLSGACVGLGLGEIPYAPLIDALRMLIRQVGEHEAGELAGPDGAELFGLVDSTGAGRFLEAAGAQVRVFNAVLRMLGHLGRQKPVLLLFEDLQWADPSTLGLVAYLTRVKSNERAMVLCTYRSSLSQGHPLRNLLAEPQFTGHVHRLSLNGFTKPEFRAFTHDVAGEVDLERLQRIFDLSQGNPFYAGLLLTSRETSRLPDDVKELMRAQLDQLSEHAAAVTRIAAIAGRRVGDRLLATVCEMDEPLLDNALRECERAQILIFHEVEQAYEFRHPLLRETVYEGLTARERRRVHSAMARALAADEHDNARAAMEMAHHWYQTENKHEALTAAVRAGKIAVRMRAFQEAEALYRNALDLWRLVPDPQAVSGTTRVRVLAAAADAARWAGHLKPAVDWAGEATAEWDAGDDPAEAGELYERLGSYQWEAGAMEDSLEAFQEAQRRLENQPASAVKSRVASKLATATMVKGNYSQALGLARSALEMALEADARAEQGRALNSTGLALTMRGSAGEGVPLLREAVEIAEENDHLEDLFRAYGNLGLALEHSGDLRGAVSVLHDGLAQARVLGVLGARQVGVLANNACAAMYLLGRWEEAATLLEEMMEDRPVRQTLYMRLTLAQIEVARGRWEQAQRLLAEVSVHPNADPRFLGPLYICAAEIEMWRGDLPAARAAVDDGMDAVSSAENSLVRLQLCAAGLRAAADECLSDPGVSAQPGGARAFADRLLETARQVAGQPQEAEIAVLLSQCEAEWSRAGRTDTAEGWTRIAENWVRQDQPFPAAYARLRQAEAEFRARRKNRSGQALRLAHAAAQVLGAEPLRDRIEAFSQRHRVLLTDPATGAVVPAPRRPYDGYKLTTRELEVLRGACDGYTRSQVAARLFISVNTVNVHTHNAIHKLGVTSWEAAVMLANKHGFFTRS